MSIESIKARLEADTSNCPGRGLVSECPGCADCVYTELRALLKVAEAAKARLEVWTEDTYRELRDALAELEATP